MSRLDIRTLGPLSVRRDGHDIDLGSRKQRALLTLLLIHRRKTVSMGRIVTALWGDDAPPARRRDVWVYVSRLRSVLNHDPDLSRSPVLSQGGGYLLDVGDEQIDATRFEGLAAEGRRLLDGDPAAASLVLGEALAMWSGPAYGEFALEDFAAAEVARLEEARLAALEMRVEADLAWRNNGSLVSEIEGLATAHPTRGRFTASLMLALYRSGRQADALQAYRRFATRLADELGLDPPDEVRLLEEQILLDDPALKPPLLRARLPLPVSAFFGRDAEVAQLSDLLAKHRLVTLTGVGGVGKTALAMEVGRRLSLKYEDAASIDLTRAELSGNILGLVAEALGVRTESPEVFGALVTRLGERRVLLVFDNCEPVVAEAAQVILRLLENAPGLRVLATSRIVLGVSGEQVVSLLPLDTAPDGDAEQLLADRVAALGSPASDSVDSEQLRELCVKTVGLPLAIELAAAQLRTWSANDVIKALDDPLGILAAPGRAGHEHHRELRANIAWSERLLPAPAAVLLRRLSVFRSSFTFDAAASVAGFTPLENHVIREELPRLVESSLVGVQPTEPTRYRLLEPVRQYAELRLRNYDESAKLAERHARHYISYFCEIARSIDYGIDAGVLERTLPDDDNLRRALRWAIDNGDETSAQRAAAAAIPFWRVAGNVSEALTWIDAVLEMESRANYERAELLFRALPFYMAVRGAAESHSHIAELTAISKKLDNQVVSAWATLRAADSKAAAGECDIALKAYADAVEAFQRIASPDVAYALHGLGWHQHWCGRLAEAQSTATEIVELAQGSGWPDIEGVGLTLSSWIALENGDFVHAEDQATAAGDIQRRIGQHRAAAIAMYTLAISSFMKRDASEALRRINVALPAVEETGHANFAVNALLLRADIQLALGAQATAMRDVTCAFENAENLDDPSVMTALIAASARATAPTSPDLAATLFGARDALADGKGFTVSYERAIQGSSTTDAQQNAQDVLGASAFTEAWDRGTAMDLESAVALARSALDSALEVTLTND